MPSFKTTKCALIKTIVISMIINLIILDNTYSHPAVSALQISHTFITEYTAIQ